MLVTEYVKKSSQAYNIGNFVACFNKDNIRLVQVYVLLTFCHLPWECN